MDSGLLPVLAGSATEGAVAATLPGILRWRAEHQPDTIAYRFLRDGNRAAPGLTYGGLHRAASGLAARLAGEDLVGRNVILAFPPGLEFVRALLGCQYARVTAIPLKFPGRRRDLRRLCHVAGDAAAGTVLTTGAGRAELLERFPGSPELTGLRWIETDRPTSGEAAALPEPGPASLALLQYTSGSTSEPRGVMVTHRNLCQNAAELDELWPLGNDGRIVSWLPMFHDMGLLFGVVLPLWAGVPSCLMAPEEFIRRPVRWLEAISRYRGTHAAAPNFAYELCVQSLAAAGTSGLDLSSWRVAVNGAEPVRAATLRRFAAAFAPAGFAEGALCPGYGLAENTLKVAGSRAGEPPRVRWVLGPALRTGRVVACEPSDPAVVPLVSCGAPHPATDVRIVDPRTSRECPPDAVGEIWVRGPCVARGYWARPGDSRATFQAQLAGGEPGERFLRTGDLGFRLDQELYVTGRLKDLIIHQGRNYYPQDIEESVEQSNPALHPSCAAAFWVPGDLTERLVVVLEVNGRVLKGASPSAVAARVAATVRADHGLPVHDVVLIRRGTLPRTSSGKVRRQACRTAYLAKDLTLARSGVSPPGTGAGTEGRR
jgi:long-chain fatty acid adenylase/transferase FadD26